MTFTYNALTGDLNISAMKEGGDSSNPSNPSDPSNPNNKSSFYAYVNTPFTTTITTSRANFQNLEVKTGAPESISSTGIFTPTVNGVYVISVGMQYTPNTTSLNFQITNLNTNQATPIQGMGYGSVQYYHLAIFEQGIQYQFQFSWQTQVVNDLTISSGDFVSYIGLQLIQEY